MDKVFVQSEADSASSRYPLQNRVFSVMQTRSDRIIKRRSIKMEVSNMESRRLYSKEAKKFEKAVAKLVRRWKYLFKLDGDIEIVAVKHCKPGMLGVRDATIEPIDHDNRKYRLEIPMEDRHPYVLERIIVHELLHIPFMKFVHDICEKNPQLTEEKINESTSSPLGKWEEQFVDYWAETLVCLAHGFYPQYGTPPKDNFFALDYRLPMDLRLFRNKDGEYCSPIWNVPINNILEGFARRNMLGLCA
jgi:hypothetical protein